VDCCCLSGMGGSGRAIYVKVLIFTSSGDGVHCPALCEGPSICKCTMNLILENFFSGTSPVTHG
jgi:hypothetical protein